MGSPLASHQGMEESTAGGENSATPVSQADRYRGLYPEPGTGSQGLRGQGMKTLRQDQVELLVEVEEAIEEGLRRIMVQAATGMGKTICAAALVRRYRELDKRVIF